MKPERKNAEKKSTRKDPGGRYADYPRMTVAAVLLALAFFAVNRGQQQKYARLVAEETRKTEEIKRSMPPAKFTFAILGDTQDFDYRNPATPLRQAVANLAPGKPRLSIFMGDLADTCDGGEACFKQWAWWKEIVSPLGPKIYAARGNHDREPGMELADKAWRDFFAFPDNGPDGYEGVAYSFDYRNSHFIFLDTEKPLSGAITNAQLDWLEKDLDGTGKENIFIFFHQSNYPSNPIEPAGEVKKMDRFERLWRIIDSRKVSAIFSGHNHHFCQRAVDNANLPGAENSTTQFIIGNADVLPAHVQLMPETCKANYNYTRPHYALVDVIGDASALRVYSSEGELLYTTAF